MKGEILESVQQVVQFGFVVYHSHDTGPALVRLDQETAEDCCHQRPALTAQDDPIPARTPDRGHFLSILW